MPADASSSQIVNTTQPTPLKSLVIRGVKKIPTIKTIKKGGGPNGDDLIMIVNEEDYDKELHGEKVDKLPTRGKKAAAAEASDKKEEEGKKEE